MKKLFLVLGFVFSWLVPFGVVYLNHVILSDASYDVDMFGLLIVLALILGLVKMVDNKIEVWELNKEHKVFIINWRNSKKIILILMLTWVLFTIEDDLGKMQLTALLITCSFIIGWLFTVLGVKKDKKRVVE